MLSVIEKLIKIRRTHQYHKKKTTSNCFYKFLYISYNTFFIIETNNKHEYKVLLQIA